MRKHSIYQARKKPSAMGRILVTESGVTAIEFAIILPVFLLFLIGLLELGLVRFGNSMIDNMITQLARTSMVGCRDNEFTGGTCDAAFTVDVKTLRQMVQRQSGGFVRGCDASLFKITANPLAGVNAVSELDNGVLNLGQGGDIVIFYSSYKWPVMFPWMQQFFGTEINYETVTVVRNEPFGDMGAARVSSSSSGC